MVCVNEISHSSDLRVVLVARSPSNKSQGHKSEDWWDIRLGLLTVERVDLTTDKHVGQYEVLQDLNPLSGTGFVVVLEGFEEVFRGAIPFLYQER